MARRYKTGDHYAQALSDLIRWQLDTLKATDLTRIPSSALRAQDEDGLLAERNTRSRAARAWVLGIGVGSISLQFLSAVDHADVLSRIVAPPVAMFGYQSVARVILESSTRVLYGLALDRPVEVRIARAAAARLESMVEQSKTMQKAGHQEAIRTAKRELDRTRRTVTRAGMQISDDRRGRPVAVEGWDHKASVAFNVSDAAATSHTQGATIYAVMSGVAHGMYYTLRNNVEALAAAAPGAKERTHRINPVLKPQTLGMYTLTASQFFHECMVGWITYNGGDTSQVETDYTNQRAPIEHFTYTDLQDD